MNSVNSDDSPPYQSPPTQRSSTNSRNIQEMPTRYGHTGILGEGSSADIFQTDDESRSARIEELQKALDALRAQQGSHRDRFAQSRNSHFSGERDERHQLAHGREDRIHPSQLSVGGDHEKGWKLEIKRWKRVNNRNGFSDIYDESEKIEDIRKREREIRSGGITLSHLNPS